MDRGCLKHNLTCFNIWVSEKTHMSNYVHYTWKLVGENKTV